MQFGGDSSVGTFLGAGAEAQAILVVSSEAGFCAQLLATFSTVSPSNLQVFSAETTAAAARILEERMVAIAFCELHGAEDEAAEQLLGLLEVSQGVPVIAVGSSGDPDVWPMAVGLGAQDYITLEELAAGDARRTIRHAIERHSLQGRLEENLSELEKAKTQFQSLITDNADALVIVSHAMVIRYANPAAEQLLGRPLDDLVGGPFEFDLDTSAVVEATTKRKDGSVVVLAIRYMDTLWEGSRAYIASLRDITERKTAEEALALAKTRAEGASKMKSQFLANMSHELRTPLNSILGFSQLMGMELHGELGSERYKGYIDNISSAGSYLLELINDLLDLSKIEAGQLELVEEAFAPAELISDVAEALVPRIGNADLTLTVRVPDPDLLLLADERKVKQVLFNLLSNAVKFTPAGGEIQIGCRLNRAGELVLFVCDNGIGMPADQIPKALAAFGQVDNAYTRAQDEGTGLGLTLSKKIAELHGGSLKIRSAIAKGTNVLITFPAKRVQARLAGMTASNSNVSVTRN